MDKNFKKEIMFVAYYLSKDALFLYLFFAFWFLVAEIVLPGIFSQRINFFFVYAGLFALMGAVSFLGYTTQSELIEGKELTVPKKRRHFLFFLGAIAISVFFVPVVKNVHVFVLPIFVLCIGMVLLYGVRDLVNSK